jgi:hypothetical protein
VCLCAGEPALPGDAEETNSTAASSASQTKPATANGRRQEGGATRLSRYSTSAKASRAADLHAVHRAGGLGGRAGGGSPAAGQEASTT